jgi:hypothetical protein
LVVVKTCAEGTIDEGLPAIALNVREGGGGREKKSSFCIGIESSFGPHGDI